MRAILFVTAAMAFTAGAIAQAVAPAAPAGPSITKTAALNHATIVSISGSTPDATIYYTTDGATPTAQSTQYLAPFLVASDLTVKAVAIADGKPGAVSTEKFTAVNPGSLVWSDEFNSAADLGPKPDPDIWAYDTGHTGFGNQEFEHYCAWGDANPPCDPAHPNAFVGPDGYLHIVALQPTPGVYTSARLKTAGHLSVFPGSGTIRIEARMKLPEDQGMWPAFWTLGNTMATDAGWPASGEQDIMEHINAPKPDWIAGSLHGTNGDTTRHYPTPPDPAFSAADWHTYGILWSKGKISFYVDSPANIYTTNTPADFNRPGAVWPFDNGNSVFLLLNLAIGGNWPKAPDATTKFPAELLVDYVRVYTN